MVGLALRGREEVLEREGEHIGGSKVGIGLVADVGEVRRGYSPLESIVGLGGVGHEPGVVEADIDGVAEGENNDSDRT